MFGTTTTWSLLVDGLARHAVAPVLDLLGISPSATDPREVAQYFIITSIQVAIIAGVFRPMEKLWPAEPQHNRKLRALDRSYTLIKLFGALPLFTYFVLAQFARLFAGDAGNESAPLLPRIFPWFTQHPVLLFVVYYAIYDFVYYLVHRLQQAIPRWWALHSLHHSQRELGCWSNDRDHYLDDLLEALIVAGVAVFIGVAPIEYALLVLGGELLQNLDHANIRLRFGPVLDKILVDPSYHRLHHMRVDPARPGLHNCNYSFVFPIWDILFGTALYGEAVRPTGVGRSDRRRRQPVRPRRSAVARAETILDVRAPTRRLATRGGVVRRGNLCPGAHRRRVPSPDAAGAVGTSRPHRHRRNRNFDTARRGERDHVRTGQTARIMRA